MKATVTLARWLGPWADPTTAPRGIAVADDDLDGLRVRIFSRSEATFRNTFQKPFRKPSPGRAFLIAPGLHYLGVDDPRMDRFCRILAAAGHIVVAPALPDFLALTPNAGAKRDFQRVFCAMPRWTNRKPVLFSFSFGSLLAFAVASKYPSRVERLVIFGGYADFREMLRFSMTGEVAGGRQAARDPMNQPVVLMNLLHLIECADRPALIDGWRRYVEATWGRPEMKLEDRHLAVAEQLAESVPANVRELFLIGTGVHPGAATLALEALARFDDRDLDLDPSPDLAKITNRVDLVHGTDDDVIPWEHSPALAKVLPQADVRVHVTGTYGHTGASNASPSMIAREVITLYRVLRAMS